MDGFFPHNAVCYFISYYDYYQPEAYIPQRDIYIEKDASINEKTSIACDSPRPVLSSAARTSSSSHRSRAFTASARPPTTSG